MDRIIQINPHVRFLPDNYKPDNIFRHTPQWTQAQAMIDSVKDHELRRCV